MADFGASWMIISLNAERTSTALVTAGTLLAIAFAVVLVRAASFLPSAVDAEDGSSGVGEQHAKPVFG
jgi:hypothetical protein